LLRKYVDIKRIEFVVTWQCNSHCKHCSVGDKKISRPVVIDADVATRIVREITRAYSPASIMTFGGEPLLYPDIVCSIHKAATDCGISRREIITNAGWPRSEKEFTIISKKLADSGVNNIAVSVDAFHQEYIPIDVVGRNVRALINAGIPVGWNPCWVVSREHNNPWNERTKAILSALVNITGIVRDKEDEGNNVQPAGRALKWLREYFPSRTKTPLGTCEDVPYTGRLDMISCVSIEPDADIKVCNEYSIGSASERNVVDILQDYDPYNDPEVEAVLIGGTTKLAEYAWDKGILPDQNGYYTICDISNFKNLDRIGRKSGFKLYLLFIIQTIS
jgi:hypothetical protein